MRLGRPVDGLDIDLDSVDLFDPWLYAEGDPHPIWAALRERSPVHRQQLADGRHFWSVTRYHDSVEVLRNSELFSSEQGTLLCALALGDPAGGKMMAATDPPRHTQMREPLNQVLSLRAINARRPQLQQIARRALLPLLSGEPWDLAADLAAFPMVFTGTLMGIPELDWPALTRLTTMAIAPDDPEFQEVNSRITLIAAHHGMFDYFSEQVAERARWPLGEDLISHLMTMTAGNRRMSHDEVVYNCYSLLLGANVTTPHAVAGTVLGFIEHPQEYRRLAENPALVGSAVEEGLRWSSPANHFMRYARADVELSGVRVPAGDALAVWLGSANRDGAVFDDPYRFDVARRGKRHLAFGFGPHTCVGAPLARISLKLLFAELVQLVEEFQLAGPVEHLCSNFVAGIKHLPVTATLRPGAADRLAAAAETVAS
ncbi:MAG: cytochrome P450 [Actinobacteria bacterium]|nr:cytochrome P450 [Actinomycetota bacterium]